MRANMSDVLPAKKRWVVLNTHPHKERFAFENLARQSFEAYCPRLHAKVRHARRTQIVLRPLFPGYLFAAIDLESQRWRPLLSTFGIRSVVRSGEQMSFLPDGFVEALRGSEVDGAIVRPPLRFQIGQNVKVANGPFEGLIVRIIDLDERERLVVLMEMLNRSVKVKLEACSVTDVLVPDHNMSL